MEEKLGKASETIDTNKEKGEANKKVEAARKEVHEEWDPYEETSTSCGSGHCKIQDKQRGRPESSESTQLGPEWKKSTVNELDRTAHRGDIILVGASWCNACAEAKKNMPTDYKGKTLIYIDYDEDPERTEEKFTDLGGTLPGKYEYQDAGLYKKLD